MTQHINEDTLIELTLGLLDSEAESEARNHLEGCPICLGLSRDVDRTLQQIKDVAPEVSAEIPVLPYFKRTRFAWLRVAAMLAVGFGMGFLVSESLRSPSITIVRQHIIAHPPELPPAGFVACESVDLSSWLR